MPLTDFVEERLELGLLYGTDGGPRFRTTVVVAASGRDERNAEWGIEAGTWVLGAHAVSKTQLDYVKAFFRARRGKAVGFRWKNHTDFVLPKTTIGTGDDSTTTFQIIQEADTGYGEAYQRPIRKPVGGTVTVYLDDAVQASGWSVNTATGVLTFTTAPTGGTVVAVQCEFDTAVRFDTDSLKGTFLAYRTDTGDLAFDIDGIPVIEDKFA